jgi:heat shock protein HtpX
MPYTFVEIEATRGRRIVLLFATLLVVYLAGAALVGLALLFPLLPFGVLVGVRLDHASPGSLSLVTPVLVVLGAAVAATLLHWSLSVRHMVSRTLDVIGVQRLDPMDDYHRQLGNVVSEVAVATGGRRIEAVAVPARWLNAFAVADFSGRAVIGVSEGLLVRLDRDELEAVVGHEAAHLVAGDSLLATVSCSMAAVWAGCLRALAPDREDSLSDPTARTPRGSLPVLGAVAAMRGLTYLLNAWLSREREYRADATAVRLTRNPLSLAQALHAIAAESRPGFIAAGELAPLFIVGSGAGAAAGAFSGFTSTHPPVERRIEVLLGMAHAGPEALADHTPRPTPSDDVAVGPPAPPQRWFAREGLIWRGPFTAAELAALPWFGAFTPVSQGDARLAAPAWEQPEINRLLKRIDAPPAAVGGCPACGGALREVVYRGVRLHKCAACAGRLVTRERFARILARGEQPPSPEVHALAVQLVRERVAHRGPAVPLPAVSGPRRRCPACGAEMVPFPYQAILPHRVTIDRCDPCGLLWFDAKELEIIQDVLAIFGD